jgi:hypothetical protein
LYWFLREQTHIVHTHTQQKVASATFAVLVFLLVLLLAVGFVWVGCGLSLGERIPHTAFALVACFAVLWCFLWVGCWLSLGERVPHCAFVCVWAKCVFSWVLRFFSCRRWVLPLGEKVPLCAFVCVLGQVLVFLCSAVLFLPSVGVALGREGPTCRLCVCFGPSACFPWFCGSFPAVGGCCP